MFTARSKDYATKSDLEQLRDTVETRLENMKSEMRTFKLSCDDVLDKVEHISKRSQKRRQRAEAEDATQEGGNGPSPTRINPLAQRLLEGSGT